MQTAPPRIFDHATLRARLARAFANGAVEFLIERVVDDFADRLAVTLRPFPRALDLGTPTPRLAEAIAARGPAELTRVAPISATLGDGPWRGTVADIEEAALETASLDLVVSALALQYVNDLPGVLAQIRRALAPDGLFLACLVGGRTLTELRTVFARAEEEITGGASPRVAPFADLRDMGGLLQRAGFALPVTDVDSFTVRYDDMFALARDLRGMGATNALVERARTPLRRAVALRAAEIYASDFADPDGRVRATFEIVWVSGWSPHESQQKPLAPGSARMRLADALAPRDVGKKP